jgi:hypothetical protein
MRPSVVSCRSHYKKILFDEENLTYLVDTNIEHSGKLDYLLEDRVFIYLVDNG